MVSVAEVRALALDATRRVCRTCGAGAECAVVFSAPAVRDVDVTTFYCRRHSPRAGTLDAVGRLVAPAGGSIIVRACR